MKERPELPEGTSQTKSKKRSVPRREAGGYCQSLRHSGSRGAVGNETGVVGRSQGTSTVDQSTEFWFGQFYLRRF